MLIYFEEESGGEYPNGVVVVIKTGIVYRLEVLTPNESGKPLLPIVFLVSPESTIGRRLCKGEQALGFWQSLISAVPYYQGRSPYELLQKLAGTGEQEPIPENDIPF